MADSDLETRRRREHIIDEMKAADYCLMVSDDRGAFYHIENAFNIALSLVLQDEREKMREERERADRDDNLRRNVIAIYPDD